MGYAGGVLRCYISVMDDMSIGVAIITHRSKRHLQFCLPPLLLSPLKPKVLVVNSSSDDGTVEEARRLGAEVLVIPRASFNHGRTRELARQHLNCPIIVMMTPDAYGVFNTLEKLIQPIAEGKAALAYARQLPHHGAGPLEAFARRFNYPEVSHIRNINDMNTYGVYSYFNSNSCAAYCNQALDAIGGFSETLMGEDALAAAKMLHHGYNIAYVAEAHVHHSHGYSLVQEFRRHFDIGYSRRQHAEIFNFGASDAARGLSFAKELLRHLARHNSSWLPYGAAHLLAKWSGYYVGRFSLNAPIWFKKAVSSQDFYWREGDRR